MNLKLTFITHLLIGVSMSGIVIKVDALKCYVCGVEEDKGEDDGDQKGVQKSTCDDFELQKDNYVKECSHPYDQSCAERKEENTVVRYCYEKKFDDCKQANNVKYCYCYTDLCNANIGLVGPSDDEDLIEGSGVKITSTETDKPAIIVKEKSGGNKVDMYYSLIFIPFLATFYNK